MDFLRNWLAGIVAAGLISAVAQALTPQGALRKITRLACGLLMMAALVRPLLSFDMSGIDVFSLTPMQNTGGFEQSRDQHTKALIEGQTATYIKTRLASRGVAARVSVMAQIPDAGGYPLPYAVTVDTGGRLSAGERIDWITWVAETVGIPPERQTFR